MQRNGFLRFFNFEILWSGVLLKVLYVIVNILMLIGCLIYPWTWTTTPGAFFLIFFLYVFLIYPLTFLVVRLIFEGILISIQKAEYQKKILYCLQAMEYERRFQNTPPGYGSTMAPGNGPVPGYGPIPGGDPAPGYNTMPGSSPAPRHNAAPGSGPAPGYSAMPGSGPVSEWRE